MQIAAVADGADPKKEAARIRERHIRDAVSSKCRNTVLEHHKWHCALSVLVRG